ncbi:hypothetical protein B0T25DRAFT_593127 [Lasiosphaeria hispida]|uniref:Uncharacterized protein n=1 Tax=Lasiosphaeria hispida TaxID=260671 RepID=A0AAJ0M919_9PEZI|nr:hypothetical protein B0T25DRAFT_593127 [Lasiosphaeria hispida]
MRLLAARRGPRNNNCYRVTRSNCTAAATLYLGDILRDPLASELNIINKRKDRLPVPREKLALPPDVKTGFKNTRESLLKGRLGVWTALLTSLGLPGGADISVGLEKGADDVISAEELETQEMELDTVDDEFLTASMQAPSVKAYLAGCRDPPPALYMVTGLKIVYGASVTTGSTASFDASAGAEAGGESLLKLIEFNWSCKDGQEFTGSVPFVLAFRARKILYKRGRWEHTSWHKGASMMSSGNGDLQDLEAKVSGMGGDAVPDEDMIEYDEACVHAEESEETDWVVPLR